MDRSLRGITITSRRGVVRSASKPAFAFHRIKGGQKALEQVVARSRAKLAARELAHPAVGKPRALGKRAVLAAKAAHASAGGGDQRRIHGASIPVFWKSRKQHFGLAPTYAAAVPGNATQILASNVRALMQARGWKLIETARRSGVGKSTLANVVNYRDRSDTHASTHTVELLAKAFGREAWELLQPPEAQATAPEPGALDTGLLTDCIRAAFATFRARGALPDDSQLAAAAAFLYRRVHDGASMKQAGAAVEAELARIGTTVASVYPPFTGVKRGGKPGK